MKLSLKNVISFWLSFLFLLTTVHSHPHHGGDHSEPTVLNESDEIEHTDSITHECEKCLVKNYKSKIKTDFKISSWVPTEIGKQMLGSHWHVTLC